MSLSAKQACKITPTEDFKSEWAWEVFGLLLGGSMKKYVTGFLFSADLTQIVLIRKLAPAWQKGYFNGVGGKIEEGELSIDAMSREFKEETGVFLPPKDWTCFAKIHRPKIYDLDVYFAISDLAFEVRTIEKEDVSVFSLQNLPDRIIPNLHWLIPLALDRQADFSEPVLIREIGVERTEV